MEIRLNPRSSKATSHGFFDWPRFGQRGVGRAQVLLSAVGFGTIGIFAKFAYEAGVDAPLLLSLRFLVAGAALWTFFLLFKRNVIRIGLKDLLICAALGLAGYGVFSTLTFEAFEMLPASVVGPLFFSYPLFVMLIDWVLTRERPDWRLLMGAMIILSGITVAVHGTLRNGSVLGLFLALAGAGWYAAYVVATRRLMINVRPQTVALYVTTFAAVGFWLMGGPVIPRLYLVTGWTWVVVLAIGLVSTVMALLSFFAGLEKLGSAEASQIGAFELPLNLALSAVLLREQVGFPLLLGTALIMTGILAGQLRFTERPPRREEALCES